MKEGSGFLGAAALGLPNQREVNSSSLVADGSSVVVHSLPSSVARGSCAAVTAGLIPMALAESVHNRDIQSKRRQSMWPRTIRQAREKPRGATHQYVSRSTATRQNAGSL